MAVQKTMQAIIALSNQSQAEAKRKASIREDLSAYPAIRSAFRSLERQIHDSVNESEFVTEIADLTAKLDSSVLEFEKKKYCLAQ